MGFLPRSTKFLVLLGLLSLSYAQTISITPPASTQDARSVSGPLDPAFAGMGIEPSNIFSFTGGDSANRLSINLLQNLAGYSGIPPHLRIGGNTGDYFIYDPSFNGMSIRNNPSATGKGAIKSDSMIIGPGYWRALNRLPKDTPITFGLNMAYDASDYLDRIVEEAKACIDGLTEVRLASFEIGNEPDLWLQNGFRTGSWGGQVYTQEWLERAEAIYNRVLQPLGITPAFFEPAATASTIGTTFELSQLDQNGITQAVGSSSYGYVHGWNQHDYLYFIGVSTHPLTLDWMLNLDNTKSQFAHWEGQVSQAMRTGLPYYLREMASCGPIGMQGVSDTFGASLWTLNFFLYAASLNISSVQMHMTDNSWASPWQPVRRNGRDPYVRPSYTAWAAFAQLVGNGNGTTQISSIPLPSSIPSGYTGRIRTYAAYANGNLASIIVVNTKPSNASSSSRGKLTVSLSLPSNSGQTLYLSYLTAAGSDSTTGATWNGISYEKSSDGTPSVVSNTIQTVEVDSSGEATISVQDSEAVIANLDFVLGSNAVIVPNTTSTVPTTRGSSSHKSSATSMSGSRSTAVISSIVTSAVAAATSVDSQTLTSLAVCAKRNMFFIVGAVSVVMFASTWLSG